MACISFVFYNTYYYFLVYWILDLICTIIKNFFDENTTSEYYATHEYSNLISLNIADLLAGFSVLFTEIQMKTKKKKEIRKSKNTQELIYNDYSIQRNKFVYIFIISIFNFMACSIDFLYYLNYTKSQTKSEQFEWFGSTDIITRIIFSRIILKTELHNHHYISLIIFVIGILPMAIFGIIKSEISFYIFLALLKNVFFAIGDIFSKILLTKKFVLPHYLIFWKGIFIFFVHIILFIILQVKLISLIFLKKQLKEQY